MRHLDKHSRSRERSRRFARRLFYTLGWVYRPRRCICRREAVWTDPFCRFAKWICLCSFSAANTFARPVRPVRRVKQSASRTATALPATAMFVWMVYASVLVVWERRARCLKSALALIYNVVTACVAWVGRVACLAVTTAANRYAKMTF